MKQRIFWLLVLMITLLLILAWGARYDFDLGGPQVLRQLNLLFAVLGFLFFFLQFLLVNDQPQLIWDAKFFMQRGQGSRHNQPQKHNQPYGHGSPDQNAPPEKKEKYRVQEQETQSDPPHMTMFEYHLIQAKALFHQGVTGTEKELQEEEEKTQHREKEVQLPEELGATQVEIIPGPPGRHQDKRDYKHQSPENPQFHDIHPSIFMYVKPSAKINTFIRKKPSKKRASLQI